MGSHKMDSGSFLYRFIMNVTNHSAGVPDNTFGVIFSLREHINLVIRKFPHHTHVEVLGNC